MRARPHKQSARTCESASDAIELTSLGRFGLLIAVIMVRQGSKSVPDAGISLITRDHGADMTLAKPADTQDVLHAVDVLTRNRK
ncbi:hypothetical protein [Roseobacter sp.]|uniref:hypothetical protein n=1 Tax=Roseobacter sp. TaxID=1907202 RepID=UPI00329A3421